MINSDSYNKILGLLFPKEVLESGNPQFVLIARYEPSFTAESQITITKALDGKWSLVKHQSESGNIYYTLSDIIKKTGREEDSWLASQIRIKRTEIDLSEERFESLHRDFIDQIILRLGFEKQYTKKKSPNAPVEVIADGTTYRLWYRGSVELNKYEDSGQDPDSPRHKLESPLVWWMKRLWQVVKVEEANKR
jgi:hypothetical protein